MKTLLFALLLGASGPLPAAGFSFALIGDTPYNGGERRLLPLMLDAIGETGAALVIHVGDIKNGRSRCSDEIFADRLALFNDAPLPIVYIPGDNDWTDCHRVSNGGYDPLERLDHLRRVFFAEPRSLGRKTIALERQSATMPEHVRWRQGPVLFVGLNVPGGNNNWGNRPQPSAEYRQRMPQVLAWLRDGFALARQERLGAIVIGMQADPDFKHFAAGTPNGSYSELLEVLRAETLTFAGDVIIMHGDTHWHRIDHPLLDPASGIALPNFTRIEAYGSPFMGWVEVVVDPDGQRLLHFAAHPFAPAAGPAP